MLDDLTVVCVASRRAADPQNKFMVRPPGLVPMDDFQLPANQGHRRRRPRVTVISGSARCDAPTATIGVNDYREIEAPVQTTKSANRSLRSIVGPLVVFAAAAAAAIAFSLTPAADGPAPSAGPLSEHSVLHFPR